VGLAVRDLDKVAAYYRDLLGLDELSRQNGTVRLGAGGATLLELTHRPAFQPDDAREAGLYHTAFLMPTRADLARWVLRTGRARLRAARAWAHGGSEAIYLDDREGNGVEVYAARPPEPGVWRDARAARPTEALDAQARGRAPEGAPDYGEAPAGLRVG